MTLYRYKAAGKEGILVRGMQEAASLLELKADLRERSLTLISSIRVVSRKVNPRILMDLCLHLEQFEKAGISLRDSLDELCQITDTPRLKAILRDILKDIEGGLLFSTALSKHPSVFDPIFVGLITVGEKTGRISFVLQHLFEHLKWMDDIQAQTLKALRYPFIMALVLFMLVIVLMTVLVPEFIAFTRNFSGELPYSTRILIAFSKFLSDHIVLLFCGFGSLVMFSLAIFTFHPKGPLWKDCFLSALPIIGPLRRKLALVRFCHIFAILFESGIDILQALQTACKSLPQGQMSLSLEAVEKHIREGLNLSQSIEKTNFFPKIIVHMIKIGEQTSGLQKTLLHVKDYFDKSLKRQVEHVIGFIEPTMILCVGLIIAWIIYSVFLPLYDTLSLMEY